jgi:carboxymethylenebutenolidase
MKLMDYGLKPIDFQNAAPSQVPDGFSRRGFVMTSLASGFAVASNPVLAQAITTDTHGLVAGEVSIPTADGKVPAYHARPAKAGKHPVVLVVQEIFGVHEHIKDVVRRYAKMGYYAIAPELFARQGDVSKMTDIGAILGQVVSKVPDAQVCGDLDAAVAFAKHNPKLKAAVAYYGLLEGMKSDIKPQDPVDLAGELKVPVLGLYAALDNYIKPAAVEKMTASLRGSASGSEIVVFPNVDHGFNADYRPTYDKTAATYAAKLAKDWLKDHGV